MPICICAGKRLDAEHLSIVYKLGRILLTYLLTYLGKRLDAEHLSIVYKLGRIAPPGITERLMASCYGFGRYHRFWKRGALIQTRVPSGAQLLYVYVCVYVYVYVYVYVCIYLCTCACAYTYTYTFTCTYTHTGAQLLLELRTTYTYTHTYTYTCTYTHTGAQLLLELRMTPAAGGGGVSAAADHELLIELRGQKTLRAELWALALQVHTHAYSA